MPEISGPAPFVFSLFNGRQALQLVGSGTTCCLPRSVRGTGGRTSATNTARACSAPSTLGPRHQKRMSLPHDIAIGRRSRLPFQVVAPPRVPVPRLQCVDNDASLSIRSTAVDRLKWPVSATSLLSIMMVSISGNSSLLRHLQRERLEGGAGDGARSCWPCLPSRVASLPAFLALDAKVVAPGGGGAGRRGQPLAPHAYRLSKGFLFDCLAPIGRAHHHHQEDQPGLQQQRARGGARSRPGFFTRELPLHPLVALFCRRKRGRCFSPHVPFPQQSFVPSTPRHQDHGSSKR